MELALFFYLINVLDGISFVFGILTIIMFAVGFLSLLLLTLGEDWDIVPDGAVKKFLVVLSIASAISVVVPDKDTMYTMAAAYGVQSAADNPDVKRLAGKSLELLEKKVDSYLKEEAKDGN